MLILSLYLLLTLRVLLQGYKKCMEEHQIVGQFIENRHEEANGAADHLQKVGEPWNVFSVDDRGNDEQVPDDCYDVVNQNILHVVIPF